MNFNSLIVVIGTILFLAFAACIIWIFNRSRSVGGWLAFLLQQIGRLFAFILFLDIQLMVILGAVIIVWGVAYYPLSWGESNLTIFWYAVLIGISFIYFLLWLWWTGTKNFYAQFSSRKKEVSVVDEKEHSRKITIMEKAESLMSTGMSFIIPLMIIIGLVMLGVTCFGAFTSILVSSDSITFVPAGKTPDLSSLSDYYLWHFAELIPQIKVAKTLNWDTPFTYDEKGVGWLLLIFKALMAYIVIARFYTWNKWRKASSS